jgi:hypothetical protein
VVAAVDTSGNVGPVSLEGTGTTESTLGSETFYDVPFPGNSVGTLHGNSNTRYGIEARIASSIMVGKSLKRWKVYLRRVGGASGIISATVRKRSNDDIVASFVETIQASSLTTSFNEEIFTLATPYTIQTGDRIMIEYSGSARVEMSIQNQDEIDGDRTRRIRYAGAYQTANAQDVVGTLSSDELG